MARDYIFTIPQRTKDKTTRIDTEECQFEANVPEFVMTSCFVPQATLYVQHIPILRVENWGLR